MGESIFILFILVFLIQGFIAQAGLELHITAYLYIILLQSPQCWDKQALMDFISTFSLVWVGGRANADP